MSTGTAPYTITTNPVNPTPPDFSGGTVEVVWTITDACGNKDIVSGLFNVGGCTIECLLASSPTPCNVPGSITATASGGFPQYRFELYLASDLTFSNQLDFKLVNTEPGVATFTGLAAGSYRVLMFDQVQTTIEAATACVVNVVRDNPPSVATHCTNDQFTACGQTQSAINADYTSWFNSLAPTGGTNLQFTISVVDAQGNVVDIDGVFAPNKCGAVYTATVTYSDDCGQSGNCQGIYTVVGDTQVPVISTQNQSGDLGCNPTSIVAPTFSANDNCDGVLQASVEDGGIQTNGCSRSQTWTATVSDGCSNAALPVSITYTWKVDTTLPVITTESQSHDLGCNPTSIVAPIFSANDNCDGVLQASVQDSGIQSQGCSRSRTWTANVSDSCTNAALPVSITYTWKVDTTLPVITTQSESHDLGCNPISIVAPTFSANDNCDGVLQASVEDSGVQTNGCSRSQTWTATVSDGCTNAALPVSITYTWKVDTEAPVFSCPDDYTLSGCDQQPILVLPLATDNCDGEVIVTGVRSDNLALNAPFPVDQTITITYTAEDGCGNSASCDFTVYVTPCTGDTHCTYTQGFYGNTGGTGCSPALGQVGSQAMMIKAVTDSGGVVNFGSVSNNNYFKLLLSDINGSNPISKNNIYKMLPGGGTPRALIGYNTYSTTSTWSDNDPLNATGSQKGKINNVLLAQTMALFFNKGNDPTLSSVLLEETFATGDVTYCGSNIIVPGTTQIFHIDSSVINYLVNQNGSATVGGLYALANKALGGENISPLNHSQINNAVDAINRGFDECRIQVTVPLVTVDISETPIEKDFSIYPVPFVSNLTVLYNFDYESAVDIQVFDSTGKLFFSKTDNDAYKGKEIQINFPVTIHKGELYFIRIETNRGNFVKNILSSTN